VEHLDGTIGVNVQLENRRTLGAQGSLVVRAPRVTLYIDDLAVDRMNERCAADGTVGTNARCDLGVYNPQLLRLCHHGAKVDAGADQPAKGCGATCGN
jgi:hypothetical protein